MASCESCFCTITSIRKARKILYCVELTLPEDSLHTLDPTLLVQRLTDEIHHTVVCLGDYTQLLIDGFHAIEASEGAIRVAEADARRRGPIWSYRIYVDGVTVIGGVERRRFWIHREGDEIPISLRQQFVDFLNSLRIPGCSIDCYRLDGNNRKAT